MAEVRLVDLELIKRYSLAVRRDTVDAEELLAALDASRATVEAAMGAASDGRPATTAKPVTTAKATKAVTTAKAGKAATIAKTTKAATTARTGKTETGKVPPNPARKKPASAATTSGKRAGAAQTRRPSGG